MKKTVWTSMAVLAVIIGTWGCSPDPRVSPTGPANAESLINGYVGGGMSGDLYTVYNEETRFGASLGLGCWLIRYQVKDGMVTYWAAANVSGPGIQLANVGMSANLGGAGPAKNVWVAPFSGTECPEENTVVFLGDEQNLPPLSSSPEPSTWKFVIEMDGSPIYTEGDQPVAPQCLVKMKVTASGAHLKSHRNKMEATVQVDSISPPIKMLPETVGSLAFNYDYVNSPADNKKKVDQAILLKLGLEW